MPSECVHPARPSLQEIGEDGVDGSGTDHRHRAGNHRSEASRPLRHAMDNCLTQARASVLSTSAVVEENLKEVHSQAASSSSVA